MKPTTAKHAASAAPVATAHGIPHASEQFRASGNHRVADNDEPEPEAEDGIATRNWPMPPPSRHPSIVAGEAEARAEVRAAGPVDASMFTEAELLAADVKRAADKDSGLLQARRDHRDAQAQVDYLRAAGLL